MTKSIFFGCSAHKFCSFDSVQHDGVQWRARASFLEKLLDVYASNKEGINNMLVARPKKPTFAMSFWAMYNMHGRK